MQELASRPKTRAQIAVEASHGIDLPTYLQVEYHDRGRRLADIGADLGYDVGTISRWMDHFGIARRVRTRVA